ncbi:hypothetical protein DPMN_186261 [Dreissena polymorpha]|uniref:Ubiquitin-like domain-containing protein n=1 Tax=Dreissena polymorpha TaxID=45954 RepID=A0A9D4I9F7_DREPO|nr:hypothetical protein DPMN_186261 [Dreissena polymorpha]
MACITCKIEKLPNEFPPSTVTENCFHPILCCLRCTMKAVKDTSKCPHPDCNQPAKLADPTLKFFQAILDDMFKMYDVTDDYVPTFTPNVSGLNNGRLTVSLLTGESVTIPFNPNMDVLELKLKVQQELKHDVNKQKLLYRDKELTDFLENGSKARLNQFSVQPNSTIMLVVLLFAIPENFNDVVFDLYWGYPSHGRDYLDASCLMFSGTQFYSLCDFGNTRPCTAIRHSGDIMDDLGRKGHHTMNVSLKNMPSTVTHLFFTLSAWSSPNISRYPNPSLKFYEASKPGKDLCKTTFQHAGAYQAVVMCSLSRGKHGKWEIFESGKCSAGNARNYEPLKATIQTLISQGY